MKVVRLTQQLRCQERALAFTRDAFLSQVLNGFGGFTKTASRSYRLTVLLRFNEGESTPHHGSMHQRLDFAHSRLRTQFSEHLERPLQIFHPFVTLR